MKKTMMGSKTILAKLDQIKDLPTLPSVALAVNKLLQDVETPISKLSETIEKDPAMVAKILKLVNSAFYGYRSQVGNLPNAICVLGFNTVRNAIISVSVINSLSGLNHLESFNIKDFWKHSVAVAMISKKLSELTKLDLPDNCFVGGLLHDIGKVILTHYFKDLFEMVWNTAIKKGLPFYEAEKMRLPIGHPMLGSYLAKKWQLPQGIVDAIEYHHSVKLNASNYNLLTTVHIADIILNTYNPDSENGLDISRINADTAKTMMPHLETIADWYPDLAAEIESACSFFLSEYE